MYDDLPIRLAVVALSCGFYLYFIFKAPAANTFFMLALLGTSSTPLLGGLRFGKFALVLQIIAICCLAVPAAYRGGLHYLAAFLYRKEAVFAGVLALVLAKAILDCFLSGFNDERIDALRVGANTVLCPAVLCLLGCLAYPRERLIGDLVKGCCAFSFANAAPLLALRFARGEITSAIAGGERLQGYSQTPLGYGAPLLYGLIGCLALLAVPSVRSWVKGLLAGISFSLLVGILLTGSRQYVVGALVTSLGAIFFLLLRHRWATALFIIPISLLVLFSTSVFSGAAIAERVKLDVLEEDGRFEIWKGSYEQMMGHPITGIGFRKAGRFMRAYDSDTREVSMVQDDAHGFFQNIFVDHGVPLGLLSLLSFVAALLWTLSNREITLFHGVFTLCLLGPCGAGFFSGNIQNIPAFYIFGILAAAITISPPADQPLPQTLGKPDHLVAEKVISRRDQTHTSILDT